jgi:outer membrane protein OmpA-like peptidoglycan-associated protein
MKKTIVPLLLLSAVIATPASANYFSNPRLGVNLNVGSAPNPRPEDYRRVRLSENVPVVEPAPPPRVAELPPLPPPPAPPPPPPAPYVHDYTVFFDFDRSTLTPEARDIVAKAVETAKTHGPVHITITGHTDTVGSRRYNQALSERRANAVRNEMVRMGMNSAEISTMGRSFDDPLIPTGPGVREPQNRRATIELGNAPVASAE